MPAAPGPRAAGGGAGGAAGGGGSAEGGAIYNAGTLSISHSTFESGATGGSGGSGGSGGTGGRGGGGGCGSSGTASTGNPPSLPGHPGGAGAPGGTGGATGTSGNGGNAYGGVIYTTGHLAVSHSVFEADGARGGPGGPDSGWTIGGRGGSGGSGGASGLYYSGAHAVGARGGNGGNGVSGAHGGDAFGGAIYYSGPAPHITDSLMMCNSATGGAAASFGGGGQGGAGGYSGSTQEPSGSPGGNGAPGTSGSGHPNSGITNTSSCCGSTATEVMSGTADVGTSVGDPAETGKSARPSAATCRLKVQLEVSPTPVKSGMSLTPSGLNPAGFFTIPIKSAPLRQNNELTCVSGCEDIKITVTDSCGCNPVPDADVRRERQLARG